MYLGRIPEKVRELILNPWTSYEEAKARSQKIDVLLGFQIDDCEAELKKNGKNKSDWSHLSAQSFQTPYPEIAEMLRLFQPAAPPLRWIDFGAAYGRFPIVLSLMRPNDVFYGYEISELRTHEANRILESLALPARIECRNVLDADFTIPEFDVAFIFDFGSPAEVAGFLEKLRHRGREAPISVIARGRGTRHLIETSHAWLSQVEEAYHHPHFSLYRSSSRSAGPCRPR